MRIAVLSDIHGNLRALEAVCDDLDRRGGADAVVNLGDSLSGPLLPKETAAFLMSRTDWTHLAGNHERQLLELDEASNESDKYAHSRLGAAELEWIASQRPVQRFDNDILLCHGSPRSDVEALLENGDRPASAAEIDERLAGERASLVLCGHSHVPRVVLATSGATIVNPGSVGLQAYAEEHPLPHRIETGSPAARYAVAERRGSGGEWTVDLIAVAYDFREMASLAWLRQREDWAHALATGRVA